MLLRAKCWLTGFLPLLLLGCQDVVETGIRIKRSAATPCRATVNGKPQPMDAYLVSVLMIPEGAKNAQGKALTCQDCAVGQSCALLSTLGVCGPDREPGVDTLATALTGLRVSDLQAGFTYCVRAEAFQVASLALPAGAREATCDVQSVLKSTSLPPVVTPVRGCAQPAAPVRLDPDTTMELDLVCLDDAGASDGKKALVTCLSEGVLLGVP